MELPWGLWWSAVSFVVGFLWDFYRVSLKGHKPMYLPGPREEEAMCQRKPGVWGGQRWPRFPGEGDNVRL